MLFLQGMSLVPAVTELILAELLYLQYDNPTRPVYMYINSAGVTVSPLPALCPNNMLYVCLPYDTHSLHAHLLLLLLKGHADRHLFDCML